MLPVWNRLLESPDEAHLVQFYGSDESALSHNVTEYLFTGIRKGEAAIVIATKWHTELFVNELNTRGIDARGRVTCLDAHKTLNKFMVDGLPDWERFHIAVGPEIQKARDAAHGVGARAYGEMVGLLWTAGQFAAAIRLEQFWNRLLSRSSVNLFCAYPIDVLSKGFDEKAVHAVLCNHTHVIPARADRDFEPFMLQAMDEVLGPVSALIKPLQSRSWAVMPRSEAVVLALRRHAPDHADEILELAQERFRSAESLQ
jgi:hypothetical protein